MIDLNALENDPFSTYPVHKEDLKQLAAALAAMEERLNLVTADAARFYDALLMMSEQNEEPKARTLSRRALNKGNVLL